MNFPAITMFKTATSALTLLATTLMVQCPQDEGCPPNWCHAPEVAGPPPECKCIHAGDIGIEPPVPSTASGTVSVSLPPGWQLQSLHAAPDAMAIRSQSSDGVITVPVDEALFKRTSMATWVIGGDLFAPPSVLEGPSPAAAIAWANPITISALRPNGQHYTKTFDISESVVPLTSSLTADGVAYSGAVTAGPVTVSVAAEAVHDP